MRALLSIAVLLVSAGGALAQSPVRPVVVELFTSEGCSSCPPADAFLAELARTRPDVLALGFHVTYWNGLGWRDPYSLDAATARQRHYARLLGTDGVYTPQIVVGGRRDVVGSDRTATLDAIHAAAAKAENGPTLTLTRSADTVTIDAGAGEGRGTIWLIGYDDEHRTPIGRGENAGRTLTEVNIVRDLVEAGSWTGAQERLIAKTPQGERVAVMLQSEDGRIVAAVRQGNSGG